MFSSTSTSNSNPKRSFAERPGQHYGTVAIFLHWLLVPMLLVTFGLGWYMTDLAFSPTRIKFYNWHKWAGVTVLVLSALRLIWRLVNAPPGLPMSIEGVMPPWQRKAHQITHTLLYVLFFTVPLSGWAYSSAVGFPLVWFGWLPLPDFVPVDRALADAVFKPAHQTSVILLAALVLLHVGAALKHHFIDRDGLLARMWFTQRTH